MNHQNIPRDDTVVKRAFLSKLGAVSFFDYKQIEPRLFAFYAATALKDDSIVQWFLDGRDAYSELAAQVLATPAASITKEERQNAKVWFLMTLYSAGPRKISETITLDNAKKGLPPLTYAEARDFYLQFHERLPQIKMLSNPSPQSERGWSAYRPGMIENIYKRRGYLVSIGGRRLHAEQWGEHKLLNKLIQGSAADIMKQALVNIHWHLAHAKKQSHLVSVVHDEAVIDGPLHELPALHAVIPGLMINKRVHDVVPIEVDHELTTTNWAAKLDYDEWLTQQGWPKKEAA